MCVKSVLNPIPRTQYRPICVTVNHVIVSRPTAFRRRFNLRKENWSGYTTNVDILIDDVDPTPENCEESKSLYDAYKKQYTSNPFDSTTIDTGNEIISKMAAENKRRWEEMINWSDWQQPEGIADNQKETYGRST